MPAAIVATSLLDLVSTREIVPSPWLSVQTESAPTVRKRGCGPMGIVAVTLFVCGSDQSHALERGMPVASDDDVIMNCDA